MLPSPLPQSGGANPSTSPPSPQTLAQLYTSFRAYPIPWFTHISSHHRAANDDEWNEDDDAFDDDEDEPIEIAGILPVNPLNQARTLLVVPQSR